MDTTHGQLNSRRTLRRLFSKMLPARELLAVRLKLVFSALRLV
jgi:hypothetical protein